ncbi:MAG: BamA/TamA family outer membrane protein [Gemmatimonadota bacterium]
MTERAPIGFGLVAVLVVLCALPGQAAGQEGVPLFLVGPDTDVRSVGFAFPEGQTLDEGSLEQQLALRGAGPLFGVRSVLGHLPLIPSPSLERFDPPSVLRDVVRLERYYRSQGFPEASVSYDVTLDTASNRVAVRYVVTEGSPLVLDTMVIVGPEERDMEEVLHADLVGPWDDFERSLGAEHGRRLSSGVRAGLEDRISSWLRDRGYPYPTMSTSVEALGNTDAGRAARFQVTVAPGRRMRVGSVRVEGNRRLTEDVLLREVPLEEGDWFSRARLADGQSELFGLDMVRIAVVETEPDSTADDRVDVRVRITEGSLHLLSSRLGWGSGSGVSGDVSWSHRDFLGGARTLEISTQARTGYLAPEANAERRYGLSVSLRQPWLGDRRVEGVLRPFVEYRDDVRDESVQWGTELSALYRRGPRRNVTLRYSLTSRRVIEAGAGAIIGSDLDFFDLLVAVDTLDLDRRTSRLSAIGRWARTPQGDPGPHHDWNLFGSAEMAGPRGLSTVEYGKVVGQIGGYLPLGASVGLRARVGGGRVFPWGLSVPAADGSDRLQVYFKLRDAVLTAGGAQDVRGWGTDLLGPKAPDFEFVDGEPVASSRYLPLGGLARWSGSLQFEVPLPVLGGGNGIHAFLDGGRVWTPDGRFIPEGGAVLPDQLGTRIRWGTGVGVSIGTPVGPVQLDVGYKLNPSTLDVRDAGAVGQALIEGRPISDVPERPIQRWHLHLSLGGIS